MQCLPGRLLGALARKKPPVQDTDVVRKFSGASHGRGAYERKLPEDTDVVRKFSKAPHGCGAKKKTSETGGFD